ncbi:MAG: FkbM family methyltransferase [Bacteroidota bacterium]|nr:FkbM family methyltransferase [Bacteroidota bacterium]
MKKGFAILRRIMARVWPSKLKKWIYYPTWTASWRDLPSKECEPLIVKELLEDNSVFFDIGANIGIFTFVAEQVIPSEHIYTFEPIPELFHRLKRTFPKVNVCSIALSDKTTSGVVFKIPIIKNRLFDTRGTLNVDYKEEGETGFRNVSVNVSTLDDFLANRDMRTPSLVKIDVEGHEFNVLKGAQRTLEDHHPLLLVEIEQRHHSEPIQEIFDWLYDRSYQAFYLDFDGAEWKKLDVNVGDVQKKDLFKTQSYINNFLFIPDRSKALEKIHQLNERIRKSRK